MKLQAVTISIYYADYLAATLANARHFDRWIIVTVADDRATIQLCQANALECIVSARLQHDGWDFDPATRKEEVLAEGIAQMDREGCALALDADIVLPEDFRRIVTDFNPRPGRIYGARGRRICDDPCAFAQLSIHARWAPDEMAQGGTSYLSLFVLEPAAVPFPTSPSQTIEPDGDHSPVEHDREECRTLPCVVLHAGPTQVNRRGRVSPEFRRVDFSKLPDRARTVTEYLRVAPEGRLRAVVLGPVTASGLEPWRRSFDDVYVLDRMARLHDSQHSDLFTSATGSEEDLGTGHRRNSGRVRYLDGSVRRVFEALGSEPIDVVYAAGEIRELSEVELLLLWALRLRNGGILCGDCFGSKYWGASTILLSHAVGIPDAVRDDGFWIMKKPDTHGLNRRLSSLLPVETLAPEVGERSDVGIVIASTDRELHHLTFTIYSIRETWDGPITVFHWGRIDDKVRALLCRVDVRFQWVGPAGVFTPNARDRWQQAGALNPYRDALLMVPGTVFPGSIRAIFNEHALLGRGAGVQRIREGRSFRVPVMFAQDYDSSTSRAFLCDGCPDQWSDAAWEYWSKLESSVISLAATEIRMPTPSLILSFVDEQSVGYFERAALTWRFPKQSRVIILHTMPLNQVWLPQLDPGWIFWPIEGKELSSVARDLGSHASAPDVKGMAYISPRAGASPGAELFLEEFASGVGLAFHAPPPPEKKVQTDRFYQWWQPPQGPLIGWAQKEVALAALTRMRLGLESPNSWESSLRAELYRACPCWSRSDLNKSGWHFL